MEYEPLYWHWVIFGFLLMLSEIFLISFFILWFGAAAIVIGGILYFFPELSLTWQIFLWTALSTLLAIGWFQFLKPLAIDKTKAGLSREAIVGQIGQVLSPPHDDIKGKLRFPAPILGADEWLIISQAPLSIGDRVKVIDLSGNSLIVTKV
ncbi:hypothetical protein A9Q81_19885 [Gammaproteobacteria bacterium 42_54_T18]|nr:hypothetical protein A9Q81_19885 [Gammaproteobacteria bacterium 42_54_T18]